MLATMKLGPKKHCTGNTETFYQTMKPTTFGMAHINRCEYRFFGSRYRNLVLLGFHGPEFLTIG